MWNVRKKVATAILFVLSRLFFSHEGAIGEAVLWAVFPHEPKSRGLTQHGGPPGWLEESDSPE
jgi:hypothetical protein